MASYAPSRGISYHDGMQGYPGSFYRQEQYGNVCAKNFPVHTYHLPPWETASQMLASSSNTLADGIARTETGFDIRCMGNHRNSNEFLNFSAGSNHMLPPTKLSIIDGQQQKGKDPFSCMPLYVARENFPSVDPQACLAPDGHLHSQFHGYLGLDDIGRGSLGVPMPVNEALSLNHAVTWPVPLISGDNHANHADHTHPVDRSMPSVPVWGDRPTIPPTTNMQDQFVGTNLDINIPLYGLYSPFQIGDPWDESLQQDMENNPVPSFLGDQPFDYAAQHFNSLVATGVEPSPADSDPNTSSEFLTPAITRPLRNLAPKTSFVLSDTENGKDIEKVVQESDSKLGRRRKLTGEEKKGAARMREIGSCVRCIFRKLKCTEGNICEPCQQLYLKGTLQQAPICVRKRLNQYRGAFFPVLIFRHFDTQAMTNFSQELQFTDAEMRVYISLGPSYPSIPLLVSAFSAADKKFSHVPDLASTANDDMQTFATIETSLLGVRPSSADRLEQACNSYVEIMNNLKKTRICSSRITRKVFDAAKRFQRRNTYANQDPLLHNAIKITEIYLLMGKRFVISKGLSSDALPSESSKVLNRQINSALALQLRKLMHQTLQGLDERLKHPERYSWIVFVLIHLLLCICVEQIQIVVEAFLFSKTSSDSLDYIHICKGAREASRDLEHVTLEHSWQFLKEIIRGVATKSNPFKVGAQIDEEYGLSEVEVLLMKDIRWIVERHQEELAMRNGDDYHGGLSQVTSDYKNFKERNTSRLVSKALWKLQSLQ